MDSFSAAAAAAAGSTNHHPSAVPQNAHYLAEIKYPRIADPIALDKILSVLQKIRDTTKPITYKWALIDKPKGKHYNRQQVHFICYLFCFAFCLLRL